MLRLRDLRGQEDEYKKRHDEIWPELVADIQKAGFKNYSLFRRGTQIIAYVEADPDAEERLRRPAATASQQRALGGVVQGDIVNLTDGKGDVMRAQEVWHLD